MFLTSCGMGAVKTQLRQEFHILANTVQTFQVPRKESCGIAWRLIPDSK
jgi:hypothetical protein